MNLRINKVLRFWVECEIKEYKRQDVGPTKAQQIATILRKLEKAGDAMRYLNSAGRVAWKATPKMLIRLADAERDAEDDLADWP